MPAIMTGNAANALPMIAVNATMPNANASKQASGDCVGIAAATRCATPSPTPVAANTAPSIASSIGSSAAHDSASSRRAVSPIASCVRARVSHSADQGENYLAPKDHHLVTIARNVGTRYLAIIVEMMIGLVMLPFNLRHLGQDAYGLWTLTAGVTIHFSVFDMG